MKTSQDGERHESACILIVEDDTVLASMWQRYLQDQGFTVDVCSSVEDAEILIHSNTYDLAIVDIFLENEDRMLVQGGVTLINRMKLSEVGNTNKRRVMVLAVTGSPERAPGEYNVLGSITGMLDCLLRKPVPLERLGREVDRLLTEVA